MRHTLLIALSSALLFGGTANAAVIGYSFSATVNEILDPDQQLWLDSGPGAIANTTIHKGDTVTGRFYYDNASAFQAWYPSANPLDTSTGGFKYASFANAIELTVHSNGQHYESVPQDAEVFLSNTTNFYDGVEVRTVGAQSNGSLYRDYARIRLIDSSGSALSDGSLPERLDLPRFDRFLLDYAWYLPSAGNPIQARLNIDSIEQIGVVPEPAELAVFFTGLAAAGAARRRRAAKQG